MKKNLRKYAAVMLLLSLLLVSCGKRDTPPGDTVLPAADNGTATAAVTDSDTLADSEAPDGLPDFVPLIPSEALERNRKTEAFGKLHALLADRKAPLTWLFTGDSITANDNNYSNGYRNYSEIFEAYLTTALGRTDDRIVNTAVSGWGIKDINFQKHIHAYSPDVVYIKIGTNNTFFSSGECSYFRNGMKQLLNEIKKTDAVIILAVANPFHPDWSNKTQITGFKEAYRPIILELADEYGTLLVDYFPPYEETADSFRLWMNGDLLHPTRLGYLKLAQTLINDLGIAVAGSPLLSVDCSKPYNIETVSKTGKEADTYRFGGSSAAWKTIGEKAAEGVTVLGGANAVGKTTSCITCRTLSQLWNNNNRNGKQRSVYASVLDFSGIIAGTEKERVFFLMPEPAGDDIPAADSIAALENAIASVKKQNGTCLLLTPPCNPADREENAYRKELADAMIQWAEENGQPLLDFYGYTASLGKDSFDGQGLLNPQGCYSCFLLYYRAVH